MESLLSNIEIRAQKAQKLSRFHSLNISLIREKVTQILGFIGTNNIFDQYTKHDISHINAMFDLADKLIPDKTKNIMTSAEWLMLSLAIYFHDMGMVVTRKEFEERDKSEFPEFKEKVENGEYGLDFAAKVKTLSDPEHFLYQEYVREHHAERIFDWIQGNNNMRWGIGNAIYQELQEMLRDLDDLFKRDLGVVCLSHHRNDLDDTDKYKLEARYDNTSDSKVNLQYISIILRTADLMQITSDRTPTIAYRLISPNDPKSIVEWRKQMAVRAVDTTSSQMCKKNPNEEVVKDTITVTAYFGDMNEAEAYFGLIAYLKFAREQLISDSKIIAESEKKIASEHYHFPWKYIDDKDIETKGFEKKHFQFTLDQEAILHLLVGHTLYNDSSVVLRELTQNSLDAISYQGVLETQSGKPLTEGLINIEWDSKKRVLTFTDNGTGMSMYDIENYLLKVGASKYRADEFVKQNKDFFAISRFGIGILTCFMIADDIDITTSSMDSDDAICLSIRNVLGKYLVRYSRKSELGGPLNKNGTSIQLYLHENVDMTSIEDNIRKWVVFPEVNVELVIDKASPISIGYSSPKEALEKAYCLLNPELRIEEITSNGITLAYATKYDRYFDDYQIVSATSRERAIKSNNPIGLYIKGILVDPNSPGYNAASLLSCCNIKDCNEAQTNVARSAIESNMGKKHLLQTIYSLYAAQIEFQFISKYKKYKSYFRAVQESYELMSPLLDTEAGTRDKEVITDNELLSEALNKLPLIIIEHDGVQEAVSPTYITELPNITIIENRILSSAEYLLGEAKTQLSVMQLMKFLDIRFFDSIPQDENIMCNYADRFLYKNALMGKEVVQIIVDISQHSTILRLGKKCNRWRYFNLYGTFSRWNSTTSLFLPVDNIEIIGLQKEIGVKSQMGLFLVPNTPISDYFREVVEQFDLSSKEDVYNCSVALGVIVNLLEEFQTRANKSLTKERFNFLFARNQDSLLRMSSSSFARIEDRIMKDRLYQFAREGSIEIFDPAKWDERN